MPLAPDRILIRPRSYYGSGKGAEAEARDHPEHAGWRLLILIVLLAALAGIVLFSMVA